MRGPKKGDLLRFEELELLIARQDRTNAHLLGGMYLYSQGTNICVEGAVEAFDVDCGDDASAEVGVADRDGALVARAQANKVVYEFVLIGVQMLCDLGHVARAKHFIRYELRAGLETDGRHVLGEAA